MKEKKTIEFKVESALNDLDRKLNYAVRAKQYANTACSAVNYYGSRILGIAGVLTVLIGACEKILPVLLPEPKAEVYQTSRIKNSSFEEKYSGLAKKVSEKTGVDERILLGLIAGGKTTHADDLRENSYAGIVPLKPEEAGVTAETLSNDDEQCLLSAARVFKDIAEKQKYIDLEAAVGSFWFREKEEEAGSFRDGWQYISAAINAYNGRTRAEICANARESLMYHEGAINFEKFLATFPEEEQLYRRRSCQEILRRKIENPALLFRHKAVIEAFERYRAGDEFTWLELLPPKLAAAIGCSVAYMDGVEFKNDRDN